MTGETPPLYVSIFSTLPNLNTEVWHGARTSRNRCSPEESRKASSSLCLLCPSKKYVMYTNTTSVLYYQPSVKEFAICWNRLYYNNGCNSAQVETKKKLSTIIDKLYTWGNNLLLNYCNILQISSWSKYQMNIVHLVDPETIVYTPSLLLFLDLLVLWEVQVGTGKFLVQQNHSRAGREPPRDKEEWEEAMRTQIIFQEELPSLNMESERITYSFPRDQSFVLYNFVLSN